jgi:polyisoprenoid-binding protein YceI
MKKVLLLTGIAALFMACGTGASTDAGEAQEAANATESNVSYTITAAESSVKWKASKITGDGHSGTIAIKSGTISTGNSMITAGNFQIDMSTIAILDEIDEEMTGKLLGHLASPDFFDVANNPMAKFEISNVTADSLTGNLTIKAITKSITIPYTWSVVEGVATATSKFSIDRSQWEVKYGSSSFFKGLGDKVINDEIEFDVTLKATK